MAKVPMKQIDEETTWTQLGSTNAYYQKIEDVVFVRLALAPATTSLTKIGTLPAGYRPTETVRFIGWGTNTPTQLGGGYINNSGDLYIASSVQSNAYVSAIISYPIV